MDYQHILVRIRAAVASSSYLVPVSSAPPEQRQAMEEITRQLSDPEADPELIRRRIHQLHAAGKIDRVLKLSALGVLAASPLVRDLVEAARLASQQEFVALEEGGPQLKAYLASADRHRGVIAFLRGHLPTALEWFARALEREPSAENLGNVLAALIRLGEEDEARALVRRMRGGMDPHSVAELERLIAVDDDLVRLRA